MFVRLGGGNRGAEGWQEFSGRSRSNQQFQLISKTFQIQDAFIF